MATSFSTDTPPGLGRKPDPNGPDSSATAGRVRPTYRHYARRRETPNLDAATLAQGLGWFSIAIGAAAVIAPAHVRLAHRCWPRYRLPDA